MATSSGDQSDLSPELRKELLNDFYAEADELLTSIKSAVRTLDEATGLARPASGTTESLFRHVHTLKGIAAIVGFRDIEELAHALESALRAIGKGSVTLSRPDVDDLVAAVQAVEECAQAHRRGQAGPDVAPTVAALQRISGQAEGAPSLSIPAPESSSILPLENVERVVSKASHRFTFKPSPELDAKGINVASIRQSLADLGEILSAKPKVVAPNVIEFEFLVAVQTAVPDESTLSGRGLSVSSLEPLVESSSNPFALQGEDVLPAFSQTVRLDLGRLDELMRLTGELIVHRFRLEDCLSHGTLNRDEISEISQQMGRSLRELRKVVTRARLVPISEVFARVPFIVRDLSRGSAKQARVILEGSQTELDKFVIDRLKEPLLHLVRNAFSHGVEPTAARTKSGKSPEARITLSASSSGGDATIRVSDDGRGLDRQAIEARAAERGLEIPNPLDNDGLLKLICSPGFSTRDEADLASGRGVGMSIVASAVRELGGTLTLEFEAGKGTCFCLRVPQNLAIADAIIVRSGETACAIAQNAVAEIIQVPADQVRHIQGKELIPYREGLLPLTRLRTFFQQPTHATPDLTILVAKAERGVGGVVVDQVKSQREVVIRPLIDPLVQVPGIHGATELGDGRPILVLDPEPLLAGIVRSTESIAAVLAPRNAVTP